MRAGIRGFGSAESGAAFGDYDFAANDDDMDRRSAPLVEESYLYMSSGMGRINFGAEDGAAYLLQVAAPSADSNIDGIRQFINPLNTRNVFNGTSWAADDGAGAATYTGAGILAPYAQFLGTDLALNDGGGNQFATHVVEELFDLGDFGAAGAGTFIINDLLINGTAVTTGANSTNVRDVFRDRVTASGNAFALHTSRFDYAQDFSGYDDKLTYMTPVFNGFQAGVSWTPQLGEDSRAFGVSARNDLGQYEHGWDISARWEGHFDQFGLTLGGGWTGAKLEEATQLMPMIEIEFEEDVGGGTLSTETAFNAVDLANYRAWNLGGNVSFQAFNLGLVYTRNNQGIRQNADSRTWIAGGDYTTGPFKLGVSYANNNQEMGFITHAGDSSNLRTRRWSGGVTYSYGPGMTFRGSVHHARHRANFIDDSRSTSFLLGTQVNF